MADPNGVASIRLSRIFSASRERVFRAWTDPEQFLRWFADPGSTISIVRFDAREGGEYDLRGEYRGETWRVHGTWREVRPPERLVFTWRSSMERKGVSGEGSGDTLVTVELSERGTGTELVLVHSGFVAEVPRRGHEDGWIGCLRRMAAVVEQGIEEGGGL